MAVNIKIKDAKKMYGKNTVIEDLSLDIKGGEFFTLLGPSGCGKTTLLRMIAGFNSIEGGEFFFGDTKINDLDPAKRNIGMVFQNYAIFPHLTVRKNVEFGLKTRKLPKDQIKKDADEFLKLMHVDEYADRLPERLSGGQQQRVALARALVIRPDVLLMDEPLSNLDAKLRVEMRSVIKNIQNKLGITTVYVTHDQEEAMAVSDRIAVMNFGEIQQIGSPKELYQRPVNTFVASFIGKTNMLDVDVKVKNDKPYMQLGSYEVALETVSAKNAKDRKAKASIRPEDFIIVRDGSKKGVKGVVEDHIFLGLNTHYFIKLETGETIGTNEVSTIDKVFEKGTEIRLTVDTSKINLFSEDGSYNLLNNPKSTKKETK